MQDLLLVIERSDDLTQRLEQYLSDSYREDKDGSEIVYDARKLKSLILQWLDDSFESMKLKT